MSRSVRTAPRRQPGAPARQPALRGAAPTTHTAPAAPAVPAARRGRSRRPGPLHSVVPPALALLVSSPAIVAGLDGSGDPILALTIVAAALVAAWTVSALGWKVADAMPTGVPSGRAGLPPTGGADRSGQVALGRIEPAKVPASEAIPGTPPPPSSDMEGQVP
jgi:hypothetical protein